MVNTRRQPIKNRDTLLKEYCKLNYVTSTVLWMARSPSNCSCYSHRKNVQ